MKTFSLVSITVLLLSVSAFSQKKPDENAIKENLIKLEKQSWEAWKNRDGKFYQDFLSDDHQEIGAGGVST